MSEQREQFQGRVEKLIARFEAEVNSAEWSTRRYPKKPRDDARKVYEAPALYIQRGPTRLLLDPIGYDMPGAEGAADLYQLPACDPMASLYFEGGQWMLHYAFPPELEAHARPISAETINQVLGLIAEHVTPSV